VSFLCHILPFGTIGTDERRELRGSVARRTRAERLGLLLDDRIVHGLAKGLRYIRHNIGGVPAGATTPIQEVTSKPGVVSAMVGASGAVATRCRPATPKARSRPLLNERSHRTHVIDGEIDVTGDKIVQRGCAAFVGHMNHVGPGHQLEQLAGEMNRAADG